MSDRWIASFGVIVFVAVLSVPASGQQAQSGTKLLSPDANYYSEQGRSVGIAADGQTAVVGGRPPYIWARRDGVWRQLDKLVGSGAVGEADQGWAVAISADGNTAIAGGDNDDGSGPEGYHYTSASGAAWVWTKSDGVWIQQGLKLVGDGAMGKAKQGTSVALSADGNTAIIGGPNDNAAVGAAWVWIRIGGVWTQQGKLVGSGGSGGDGISQGRSVALSADGNTAIIEGIQTTISLALHGSGPEAEAFGGSREPSWSARAPERVRMFLKASIKGLPWRYQRMGTPLSSAVREMAAMVPPGSGGGAGRSGRSRANWMSRRTPRYPQRRSQGARCRSRRMATRPLWVHRTAMSPT